MVLQCARTQETVLVPLPSGRRTRHQELGEQHQLARSDRLDLTTSRTNPVPRAAEHRLIGRHGHDLLDVGLILIGVVIRRRRRGRADERLPRFLGLPRVVAATAPRTPPARVFRLRRPPILLRFPRSDSRIG